MINGAEYSWEDIQVILPGKALPVDGVTGIEYTVKKEHTNIYGRGDKPIATGRGKKEYSGSLSILQSELEALQASLAAGKDITDMAPFQITVAYAPEGGVIKTDILKSVRFGEVKKGMKSGDPNMEIQIPLIIGDIVFNA